MTESLHHLLARVHERLAKAKHLDSESRKLLTTLMQDIDRALRTEQESDRAPARQAMPRLEALAVQFEAEHPTLAQGLRQLLDALGKAGI